MTKIGIVVIGRNEGERLRPALRAVVPSGLPVVYADSGSIDDSAALALSEGAIIVAVDGSPPTAARGRNVGLESLCGIEPDVEYVQFVDGDTVLDAGWIAAAAGALDADTGVVAVCGHLRERDAEASTFRRLLQLEWRGPVGDIAACGGNAMYRRRAIDQAGRFRATVAGGEEPELCERLRAAGGRIQRIDAPMGVHDSAIDSLSAWWTRAVRVGAAFAALADDPRSQLHERAATVVRSAFVWGLLLPSVLVASVAACVVEPRTWIVPTAIGVLVLAQTARIAARSVRGGTTAGDAGLYAVFCMLGKAAHVQGWLVHRRRRTEARRSLPPNAGRCA